MSKYKVLHIIDSAGMYGAERVILTLLDKLRNSEYPGILGCIREREDEIPQIVSEAALLGIPVVNFTMRRGFNPLGLRQISGFIRDNNIMIAHTHGYKPNIFLGLSIHSNVKTISTVHGWAKTVAGIKERTYEYLDALVLKRYDVIIAVSKAVMCDLIKKGVKESKIRIIYNGLNIKTDRLIYDNLEVRKLYGLDESDLVICSVGRLSEVKGYDYLIKAMPSIIKEIKNCHIIIAGEGPARGRLELLINQHNLCDRVKLLGYVENVDKLLAATDLFVMPSLSEGLPISLLEAMAAGKPVIASAAGGIPEVIDHNSSGILVPAADSHALGKSIIELLRSRDKMRQIATNGISVVHNRFCSDAMAEQYAGLYRKLLS